jgi:hypothetical protein
MRFCDSEANCDDYDPLRPVYSKARMAQEAQKIITNSPRIHAPRRARTIFCHGGNVEGDIFMRSQTNFQVFILPVPAVTERARNDGSITTLIPAGFQPGHRLVINFSP